MNSLSRRDFLYTGLLASGGFVVGCSLLPRSSQEIQRTPAGQFGTDTQMHGWIHITKTGAFIFYLDRVEMGQGIRTSHAMIVAEELGIPVELLNIRTAPRNETPFINSGLLMNATGGSTSTLVAWRPLREAAAGVRYLLIQAAARKFSRPQGVVDPKNLRIDGFDILDSVSAQKIAISEIVAEAKRIEWPRADQSKKANEILSLGRSKTRLDIREKVDGSSTYGFDLNIEGMRLACVIRPPSLGGRLRRFDASDALRKPGIEQVFPISRGLAVVGNSFWRIQQALPLIRCEWEPSKSVKWSTQNYSQQLSEKMSETGIRATDNTEFRAVPQTNIEATYELPYVPHMAMEPLSCAIRFDGKTCDVYAGSQVPPGAIDVAHRVLGISADKINLVQPMIGGSFGRRVQQDFVLEACEIVKVIGGTVKVMWSREEDLKNDFYRPASLHKLNALVAGPKIEYWSHKMVAPSVFQYSIQDMVQAFLPNWMLPNLVKFTGQHIEKILGKSDLDPTTVEGSRMSIYETRLRKVEVVPCEPALPIGFWRSVGFSSSAFVVESFIDECAWMAKINPLDFRIGLIEKRVAPGLRAQVKEFVEKLKNTRDGLPLSFLNLASLKTEDPQRALQVLLLLKSKVALVPPGKTTFVGYAHSYCFGSYCAQAIYISIVGGNVRVERVIAVVDCGFPLNPDGARAQIEGGVIFGLSAALKQGISFENGQVTQRGFDTCDVLRMHETPPIDIHFVENGFEPSGVGELGVPPVAPALCNAIFAATGVRLRRLPIVI